MKSFVRNYMLAFLCLFMIAFPGSALAEDATPVDGGVQYEENPFTNDTCIEEETWMTSATVGYTLNKEKGIYELSGAKYADLSDEQKAINHIYYGVSDTGKTLYGYVPNYSEVIQNEEIKTELSNLEILTTSSCEHTLQVVKTVVGGVYDNDEEYMQSQDYDDSAIKEQEEKNKNLPTDNYDVDGLIVDYNKKGSTDKQVKVPNTASIVSITCVTIGSVLLVFGICVLLKPELLTKLGINTKYSRYN